MPIEWDLDDYYKKVNTASVSQQNNQKESLLSSMLDPTFAGTVPETLSQLSNIIAEKREPVNYAGIKLKDIPETRDVTIKLRAKGGKILGKIYDKKSKGIISDFEAAMDSSGKIKLPEQIRALGKNMLVEDHPGPFNFGWIKEGKKFVKGLTKDVSLTTIKDVGEVAKKGFLGKAWGLKGSALKGAGAGVIFNILDALSGGKQSLLNPVKEGIIPGAIGGVGMKLLSKVAPKLAAGAGVLTIPLLLAQLFGMTTQSTALDPSEFEARSTSRKK